MQSELPGRTIQQNVWIRPKLGPGLVGLSRLVTMVRHSLISQYIMLYLSFTFNLCCQLLSAQSKLAHWHVLEWLIRRLGTVASGVLVGMPPGEEGRLWAHSCYADNNPSPSQHSNTLMSASWWTKAKTALTHMLSKAGKSHNETTTKKSLKDMHMLQIQKDIFML